MRVAIIEDEQDQALQLEEYLRAYGEENRQTFQVSRYDTGEAFLQDFHSQFGLILLDISLPGMDGMQTAKALRERDADVGLLFITQMAQYAIRGYEVDAMDYLLKPVSPFAFSQRIQRAISRLRKREKQYLMISDRNGSRRLAVDEIYYIESRGHNLIYHTAKGEFTLSGTITEAESRLAAHHFFRCNKGYLVSLRHVEGVRNGCAVVQGIELLISRPRKNGFLEALTNYIGGTV